MFKRLSILGSTGSIGRQTLEIVKANPDHFECRALAAGRNVDLLAEQIKQFKPGYVSVYSEKEARKLESIIGKNLHCEILTGEEGLKTLASLAEVDIVMIAVVGIAGLIPTLEAIKSKKTVALANKETLVAGGSIVIPEARKNNVKILPVDSEHSAIFQCIQDKQATEVNKIIITASGGPFRTWSKEKIKQATVEQALNHPNWNMGPKVTIDSSTLMNKALEIIEARWLFELDYSRIEVLIHPQSIVHSLVEFIDGSVLAQLGNPSMLVPIQYALSYPKRLESKLVKPLDLASLTNLEFAVADLERFPALKLAYEAGKKDGTYPVTMNAANEVAVNAFIKRKIQFNDILQIVEKCLERHTPVYNPALVDILDADRWARIFTEELLQPAY